MKLENLIIIPTKKEKMSKKAENQLIQTTLQRFKEILVTNNQRPSPK